MHNCEILISGTEKNHNNRKQNYNSRTDFEFIVTDSVETSNQTLFLFEKPNEVVSFKI